MQDECPSSVLWSPPMVRKLGRSQREPRCLSCRAPLRATIQVSSPVTVLDERFRAAVASRYVVESEITHGRMAIIFVATDARLHLSVAPNVLRPALAAAVGL